MRNYDYNKNVLGDISDLMYYMSSGVLNYSSVAKKTGISIAELSKMLQDIAGENTPKSKFHDLDIDEYLPDFESTNYRRDNLRAMERAMNATRAIVLPIAVSRAVPEGVAVVYVSACVINYDALDNGIFEYGQVPVDPCILEEGTALAGHMKLDDGAPISWLNRELYEDCCQTAMLLTMSGVEVFMPEAIDSEELMEEYSAEMRLVTLTDLPKTLFVASLKRLQEDAQKELSLNDSNEK